MITATRSLIRRPKAVFLGPFIYRVYMVDAVTDERQAEAVAEFDNYADAQAFFSRWLQENLKRPSGFYPRCVMDEIGGAL